MIYEDFAEASSAVSSALRSCALRACGAVAINGLLHLAGGELPLAARLLDLRSSGDTAGDRRRVVGYGAFSFTTAEAGA